MEICLQTFVLCSVLAPLVVDFETTSLSFTVTLIIEPISQAGTEGTVDLRDRMIQTPVCIDWLSGYTGYKAGALVSLALPWATSTALGKMYSYLLKHTR